MKDWLSALLKVKSLVLAQRKTTPTSDATVIDAYTPFLKTLAHTTGSSVQSAFNEALTQYLSDGADLSVQCIVSEALFRHLRDKADVIADSEALAALSVDTSEFVSPKSGNFDKCKYKVSDDCLKLALSFLSISDRCKAERSCKRLFHLSRDFPIECDGFGEISKEFPTIDAKCVVRVASRMSPESDNLPFSMSWFLSESTPDFWTFELKRKVMAHLKNHIKSKSSFLQMGDTWDVCLSMDFPKLQHFAFSSDDSDSDGCRAIVWFLQRHSSKLTSVNWRRRVLFGDGFSDAETTILRCLSEMSGLRTLDLDWVKPLANCNFAQIESLGLCPIAPRRQLLEFKHMFRNIRK